jgi:DNA-directed RNA polymerase specialized sigma24 family protein
MVTDCTRELVERSMAGDRAAYERPIAPLVEPGYRLACGMLLDREEAEDAVQEASLEAWLKLRSFRRGADPRPWFLTIVANHCGDVRRRPWWAVVRGAIPTSIAVAALVEICWPTMPRASDSNLPCDHRARQAAGR